MSSDCSEEEDNVVPEEKESSREERFILQHQLKPGVPTVRLSRHICVPQQTATTPTISRHPSRGPPPPPAPPRPGMTPWTENTGGWQGGFQPWLSEVDKLRLTGGPAGGHAPPGPSYGSAQPPLSLPFMAGPSHSSHSAFTRPGFSTHTPREFLQRPVQPGFDRPLGPLGPSGPVTQIQHAAPEPGEVTIEKCEPWTPAPPPVQPVSPPARQSPPRPSPPGRRMRLRDIVTSAVRSALGNQQLDQEAERFNNEIGDTFMDALGTVVKKEK